MKLSEEMYAWDTEEMDRWADKVVKLEAEIEGLRKLAYDYIQAYEKLVFGDVAIEADEGQLSKP